MQSICRIKYEVPGLKLDFAGNVEVPDHQLPALILVRL
jgi:hypothetical protein